MRVLIAADAFKECLPAIAVCAAIASGVRRAEPDCEIVEAPMADGGPGTVEALVHATGGEFRTSRVTGPLGEPVEAQFGLFGGGATAVLETAAASGLELVPVERRNPLLTTTFGTGELIRAALDAGVARIILGIGGSATNDGGAGAAQALGYRLLDTDGASLPFGGGHLGRLARIDATDKDPRLDTVRVDVACDVTNPLIGPDGASAVFGPQKGATPDMIARLDANLAHWSAVVRRDLGVEIALVPRAGAAGGLGGGLLALTNATLCRGVELVIDAVGLRQKLARADLCITGEGAIDGSSSFGKTIVGVAAAAADLHVPVVALTGAVREGARRVLDMGVCAYFGIPMRPYSIEESIRNATQLLAEAAEQVVRLFRWGR
jgi:glycerate kinase